MKKGKTLAEKFLTAKEQQQVTEAVHQAEKKTSGEIVPMIVSRSHNYPMAAATGAVCLALPLALLLTNIIGKQFWLGPQNMWLFLGLFAILYVVSYPLFSHSDRLKRFFLNSGQVEQEVKRAALSAFYSEGLYKTKDANGILLYISVMEQKVWILADSGISDKIDQRRWDFTIQELTTGIKTNNKTSDPICAAIDQMGQILQTHFPCQKNDTDELHNLIIQYL